MKYYYIAHEGPFRNNLVIGKDFDRINRDKNKIIVTRINGNFHILICKNGVYEKEKRVLSYFELVDFIKRISFNVYFINVSSETAYFINSYVKREDEINRKAVEEKQHEPFYAIIDGKMLKLETTISRDIVKDSITDIYNNEIQDENKCHEISLPDFVQNAELFELYHLPFKEKNGQFLIPNYTYSKPKPFYILSGIYNKPGDDISLSSNDLINLYMISSIEKQIVSDIINNINVNIVKEYDVSSVSNVLDFLESYDNSCDNVDINTRLQLLRNHLLEAKENKFIVDNLDIVKRIGEKRNVLKKHYDG